jgi:hypothetical protein
MVPARQDLHSAQPVFEYSPSSQGMHSPEKAPANVPGAHFVQLVAPAEEWLPLGQGEQMNESDPGLDTKVPAGHKTPVGVAVGCSVGISVGIGVGISVGRAVVGRAVVGISVGTAVGGKVGLLVVGCALGT